MNSALTNLGLTAFFTQQLTSKEIEAGRLGRVIEVQRTYMVVSDGVSEWQITLSGQWYQRPGDQRPTVGDWVLLDEAREKITRLLERNSVFKRVAAGTKVDVQLLAANVDTLFIVTSCNEDFKESRLERYLALAYEAGVDPVVILTKADLAEDTDAYRERVRAVRSDVPVEVVNALDIDSLDGVMRWVSKGSTVALIGSSGVGKSTIVNSLSGAQRTDTAAIREQDAKGRHTTSFRALHQLANGGLLVDLPGIRELKVAQVETSLAEVFSDIQDLAMQCKFANCNHQDEPGCAVSQAISSGGLDERHFRNYQKLVREEAHHTSSLAEQRQKDRQFGKMVKQHIKQKQRP